MVREIIDIDTNYMEEDNTSQKLKNNSKDENNAGNKNNEQTKDQNNTNDEEDEFNPTLAAFEAKLNLKY